MKVFCAIPNDGAVPVRVIPPGCVFAPRHNPKDAFLCVGDFAGLRASFRVFESDEKRVDFHFMGDLRAGVNVESGRLVLFYAHEMVIPVPAYLTTGKYEP